MQHLVYVNSHCKPRAVRTVYASPFTFGNHACSINDRWFLFNRDESLLINRYGIRRSLRVRHRWIHASFARATLREKRLPRTTPYAWLSLNHYASWWLTILWRGMRLDPFVYLRRKSHGTVAKTISSSSSREDEHIRSMKMRSMKMQSIKIRRRRSIEGYDCEEDNFYCVLFARAAYNVYFCKPVTSFLLRKWKILKRCFHISVALIS